MTRAAVAALLLAVGCDASPALPDDDAGGGDDGPPADAGPDAIPPDAVIPDLPHDVDGRITINELMTVNAITVADEGGATGDWIELYNPNDEPVDLHGYGVTDDLVDPNKAILPEGVIVPAGGYLVLWLDNSPERGPTHLGFKLGREMGEVGIARPDGSWIDRVRYGEQAVDFSAAREPDGSDHWRIEWHPSPGGANPAGPGSPMGLEDEAAPPEAVPAAGDLTELLLGYDRIPEIGIVVNAAGVASLEAQPFQYVPAHLVYQGRTYGPIGLRLKGGNSFAPFSAKPSFRINVDEYVEEAKFWDLDDLTLNNMDDDFSMMHERLAYLVMRSAGVPASRANHAMVTVNDQLYGLYSNVETVKRPMLERWFSDAQGPLFEATDVDFVAADVPDYDLETGPDDRSMLYGLAAALTIPTADTAIAAANNHANMAQFRRYWAVASVIAQFDAFPYSIPGDDYFVYADPTTDRLWFMPWGMDETFYSSSLDVKNVYSVLATRCLQSPACFQDYVAQTWEVLAMTEAMNLDGERARVADQIEPYVLLDARKPYPSAQVFDFQNNLHWFITGRREKLEGMLPPP